MNTMFFIEFNNFCVPFDLRMVGSFQTMLRDFHVEAKLQGVLQIPRCLFVTDGKSALISNIEMLQSMVVNDVTHFSPVFDIIINQQIYANSNI